MKTFLKAFSICLLLSSCYYERDINDCKGWIVLEFYCGFDGLNPHGKVIQNPVTGEIKDVTFPMSYCDIFLKGDTIK